MESIQASPEVRLIVHGSDDKIAAMMSVEKTALVKRPIPLLTFVCVEQQNAIALDQLRRDGRSVVASGSLRAG